MLAYVFSHVPAPGVDIGAYEAVLRTFHETLAASRPRGFLGSLTYRIGVGYSDWYLLEDSSAMDALNEAAVTGGRAQSHGAAARMAGEGVGKLLSLAAGEHDSAATHEIRFAKPAGMVYADLYSRLAPLTAAGDAAMWRRMMVLGPPPEFCLVSRKALELPPEMRPEVLLRTQIQAPD